MKLLWTPNFHPQMISVPVSFAITFSIQHYDGFHAYASEIGSRYDMYARNVCHIRNNAMCYSNVNCTKQASNARAITREHFAPQEVYM